MSKFVIKIVLLSSLTSCAIASISGNSLLNGGLKPKHDHIGIELNSESTQKQVRVVEAINYTARMEASFSESGFSLPVPGGDQSIASSIFSGR